MADGGGRVVNVASIVGLTGYSGLSVYSATKASLIGFTRSLAREVGQCGVNVNAVAPGFLDTGMTERMDEGQRGAGSRAAARSAAARNRRRRQRRGVPARARARTASPARCSPWMRGAPHDRPGRRATVAGESVGRALALTAPIVRQPARTLPVVIDELARPVRRNAGAALRSTSALTFARLAAAGAGATPGGRSTQRTRQGRGGRAADAEPPRVPGDVARHHARRRRRRARQHQPHRARRWRIASIWRRRGT